MQVLGGNICIPQFFLLYRNFFYYLCTWKWESWKEYQKNTMKNQAKTIFVN